MSHAFAKVSFADGDLLWAEYDGTMDRILPRLYKDEETLYSHWRKSQSDWECLCGVLPEYAEYYSSYGYGFFGPVQACRTCMVITSVERWNDWNDQGFHGGPEWRGGIPWWADDFRFTSLLGHRVVAFEIQKKDQNTTLCFQTELSDDSIVELDRRISQGDPTAVHDAEKALETPFMCFRAYHTNGETELTIENKDALLGGEIQRVWTEPSESSTIKETDIYFWRLKTQKGVSTIKIEVKYRYPRNKGRLQIEGPEFPSITHMALNGWEF